VTKVLRQGRPEPPDVDAAHINDDAPTLGHAGNLVAAAAAHVVQVELRVSQPRMSLGNLLPSRPPLACLVVFGAPRYKEVESAGLVDECNSKTA
jgi:hypothetical protein